MQDNANVLIREARLDDAQAISDLLKSRVPVWQRLNTRGQVEEPPYDALTIYERWLHGGAWMSIETAAIYLSHLLTRGAAVHVAIQDGQLSGYVEAFYGSEPPPIGQHLHVARLVAADEATSYHLLNAIIAEANKYPIKVTAAASSYDTQSANFYTQSGFQPIEQVRSYTIPAKTGQGFYKALAYEGNDYESIKGWHMTIGRTESARYHWETLWPRLWDALPEITAQQTHRLHFSAAGQEALVCFQQQLYESRTAEVFCWSPKPLTSKLLIAIRDSAHRAHYRTLLLTLPESATRLLGDEAEATPQKQDLYAREPDQT